MTDILNKLIDLVQRSAPALWAIARRQIMALNIQDAAISILLLIIGVIASRYIVPAYRWGWPKEKPEDSWRSDDHTVESGFLTTVLVIITAVSISIIVTNAVTITMRLVNPDYYAIQILLDLIK